MEHVEMNILEVINNTPELSQREISEKVGLSLGMVNFLLKKFLKVGWIKAERINGNKMKYLLTPNGFIHLSKKTVDYISRSYRAILQIRLQLMDLILVHFNADEIVYIVASKDEIYAILVDILSELDKNYVLMDEPPYNQKYITWGRDIEDEHGVDAFIFDKKSNLE